MGSYEFAVIADQAVVGGVIGFDIRLRTSHSLGHPLKPVFRASFG